MMRKILFFMSLIFLLGACASQKQVSTNHYVLEYYTHQERDDLSQIDPYPSTAIVYDTTIPAIYDRKQIVIRHFGPRITYSENDLWAIKLSDIIPQLITTRFNRYKIFSVCQREFLNQKPDYEIFTHIRNVEALKYENKTQARLVMDYTLKINGEENYVIKYTVNREETLLDNELETFVQKLNDLIMIETDEFIARVQKYLKTGISDFDIDDGLSSQEELSETEGINIIGGEGLLVLPAISKTDNEGYYKVSDNEGTVLVTEEMGTAVKLPEGHYSIQYGEKFLMNQRNVKVSPRYKTVIDPDWGCLTIDVISETRDYVKTRYELFDAANGKSFGTEFPADEEQGEINKIWVLTPGLYKVTINNQAFNAYKDFTTVYVEKGKSLVLKIVVSVDEEGNPINLIGAGVLEGDDIGAAIGDFKLDNAIHGNLNFTSDNEVDENDPITSILLNTQFDSRVTFDRGPLHFTMKNLVEVETNKTTGNEFRISYDDITSKNTLIYYFLENVGAYTRLDLDTHVFPRKDYGEGNYVKINEAGDTVEVLTNVNAIVVKPSLSPFILKEGIGINYRALNLPRANLNLRMGYGRRQEYNNNYYEKKSDETVTLDTVNYQVYREFEDSYQEGTEISLVGNFQLPFDISYNTDADILIPFEKDANISIEWENNINMRLFKYISLDYKLKLRHKTVEDGNNYIIQRHVLFLRMTYILR